MRTASPRKIAMRRTQAYLVAKRRWAPPSVSGPPVWTLVIFDRLPKLHTVSFQIGDPAKLAKVVALAIWIDGDTIGV